MNRRPDASMDLLNQLTRDALEPEYRQVANRRDAVRAEPASADRSRTPRKGAGLFVGLALAGALVTMAAVQTTASAPAAERERDQLVAEVQRAERQQDDLRTRLGQLDGEVRRLQSERGVSSTPGAPDEQLGLLAGSVAAKGPGAVVTISDSVGQPGGDGEVTDEDLRQLVNGLWEAGAEAVAVNGRRLTTRTAIRMAGSAITVDYRSLRSPYRVEAIGDPRRLPAAFASTTGGAWCEYLRVNFGVGFQVRSAGELTLPADPGLGVQKATVGP